MLPCVYIAGSGVRHSEFNKSRTEPLRFIQMWINSRETNTRPNYGQYDGNVKVRRVSVCVQSMDVECV